MRQPTRSGLTISFVGTFLLLIASGCSEPPVPALLWEYPLRQVEYPGSSYPVSIDNGVVVVGIRGSELHALDAKTGQVLWRRANESGQGWHYRLSDGVVYLSQSRELDQILTKDVNGYTVRSPVYGTEVFALDARSGNEIWQYRPEPDRWAYGFLLSEGVLAVRSAPYFGVDAETGRLLWEAPLEGVTNDALGRVIFVEERIEHAQEPRYQFGVSAVDTSTGEVLWRQVHSSVEVVGAADGVVLVRRPLDHLHGLDAKTGRTLWTHHQMGRSLWPKSEGDGVVIVQSKQLHSCPPDHEGICYPVIYPIDEFCVVDMSNGKTLWCEEMEEDDYVIRLGDLVYLTSGNTGRVVNARTGEELWSREGKDGVDGAAPQVRKGGGVLYVNDYGTISALHPKTLAVRWQYQLEWDDDPSDWRDGPSIRAADDEVVVLWNGAGLTAVGLPPPGGVDSPPPSPAPEELCSNGVVVPNPEVNPGLVGDCVVLLSVRGVLVGDDGTLAAESVLNWNADLPITQWDGVSTVEPGRRAVAYSVGETPPTPRPVGLPDRVRILKPGWQALSGQVPAELAGLTGLDTLVLDSPYLTGDIPSALGQLVNLERLVLGNGLTGPIPLELGRLVNLERLVLGNGLTGPIPPELGRLVNLKELRLGNGLTGPIPSELGELDKLRFVDIHGARFSGCLPGLWKKDWIIDSSGVELDSC